MNVYPMQARRNQRMGSINASSAAGTSAPNSANIASSVSSLVSSGTAAAKGILSAEAAQNAINAEKNLTAALTPQVIIGIICVIGYVMVTGRKR